MKWEKKMINTKKSITIKIQEYLFNKFRAKSHLYNFQFSDFLVFLFSDFLFFLYSIFFKKIQVSQREHNIIINFQKRRGKIGS